MTKITLTDTQPASATATAQIVLIPTDTPGEAPTATEAPAANVVIEASNTPGDEPTATEQPTKVAANCDPSYPGVCIPSPPPILHCKDVKDTNFKVIGADPHHFDRDHDGIGCEKP